MKFLRFIAIIYFMSFVFIAKGQMISGVVTDSVTKEAVMYASVVYEDKRDSGTSTNIDGEYKLLSRGKGKRLIFSALGYKSKTVSVKGGEEVINVVLEQESIALNEVVVKARKDKYSRKNNPAVEFMKKVISNKKHQKLEENDYYRYNKYEKMKLSINDITEESMKKGIYKKYAFIKDQVERSLVTGKMILPISVQETVSEVVYRKNPEDKKEIIHGVNNNGIEEYFSSGEMLGTILKEVFANVNIYDNEIRLLRQRFVSPISDNSISFYKFYLMDTVKIEDRECVHLTFVPQNSQDFGFTGHLYVLKDSTYAVRKCIMNLPKNTGVNWVNNMNIVQKFHQLSNGNWALTDDDVTVDLSWDKNKTSQSLQVEKLTKYSDYSFEEVDKRIFKFKGDLIKEANMLNKDESFWQKFRKVPLTKNESNMDVFMNKLGQIPGFKFIIFGTKALIENSIELGTKDKPSKIDIAPVNTMVTSNYVDGLRLRLSAMTTAKLNPYLFADGYLAYGFKDKRWKYNAKLSYSFLKRDFVVWEFPKHFISASYSYDVMSPMDKFLFTDKDNVFVSFKTTTVDQMSYIRDAVINYELEQRNGLSVKAMLRHRNDEPAGILQYIPNVRDENNNIVLGTSPIKDITTSEINLTLRYAPGERFVNTKQRRIPVSLDAPRFSISHTMGLKGVLGGQYNFNRTEASIWKRFWLPSSWGRVDFSIKGGVEWNKVPFPLLIMPEANLSYITQNETFCLINNMEFLNDRFASLSMSYNMNGKLFNRIPLLRKLNWREMFRVRMLWGTLTDKNNPFKSKDDYLFDFPRRNGQYTSHVMDPKMPYIEASFGIYNIFKLLHIEYVHRFTYLNYPNINKNGLRFMIQTVF